MANNETTTQSLTIPLLAGFEHVPARPGNCTLWPGCGCDVNAPHACEGQRLWDAHTTPGDTPNVC